ncbi:MULTISPECIES: hypothetical protein [Leptospira]|uniref:Uncharacterized protein n=1 Tax=Leptospira licerasiae str. MMD4847 TaxID=1049971 RepID=A0ABP2RIF0_9LEPT|nr:MULTISPECIES: hypothetical protein [Leptospira]EIE01402.1 hypothetical protein LEP1GSC185_3445 [Leptospira licerasiae serovar Varillal str. VAR 010]EJZ43341.1 hypothetical protein LEP1GSC178_3058 [Leptospira licerasiae str. MMD4847]
MSELELDQIDSIEIIWELCEKYEDAKDHTQGIYLHEWDKKPFYWGKVDKSVFGGNPRKINGESVNPRYGSSYRHWIEGCLRHGAKLYLGKLGKVVEGAIERVEQTLMEEFPSEMNRKEDQNLQPILLLHKGKIPECIINSGKFK